MADEHKSTNTELLVQALKELGEKVGVYNPSTGMPVLGGMSGQAQGALQARPQQINNAVSPPAPPAPM